MERALRSLKLRSLVVVVFTALLCLAALAEIALAGREVARYYEHRAAVEAAARSNFMEPPPDYPLAAAYEAYFGNGPPVCGSNEIVVTAEEPPAYAWLREPAVLAALLMAVAAIGVAGSALMWVWRAHANLAEAGLRPRYGPQRALAAYLIPVANLVLPADAMRELHNRSHGENEDFAHAPVDDVTAWWLAGIAGTVILSLLVGKYLLDVATNLAVLTPLWMEYAMVSFAVVLLLACAGLFARLARVITRAQRDVLPDLQPVAEEPAEQRRTVRLIRS